MRTEYATDPETGAGLMVLLTEEIKDQLKPLDAMVVNMAEGTTGHGLAPWDDPIVLCKFFHCILQTRLYVTHGRFDEESDDWVLFGFRNEPKDNANWGSISLRAVEEFRDKHGIPFERDKLWDPIPASQVTIDS